MASDLPDLSELAALRDWITDHLSRLPEFLGVSVLSRKTANLQNEIERNLESSIGLCVIVMIPSARPRAIQSERVLLDPVKVRIRIAENVLLNKTGKSACYLAERVLSNLQNRQPAVPGSGLLVPEDPGLSELNLIGSLGRDDEEDYAGWDTFFTTKLGLTPAP